VDSVPGAGAMSCTHEMASRAWGATEPMLSVKCIVGIGRYRAKVRAPNRVAGRVSPQSAGSAPAAADHGAGRAKERV
jgi:hypothetical protein